MSTQLIQAEVNGYQGNTANLLAALDMETGLVIVDAELTVGKRIPGAHVVSNDPRIQHRDTLFTEEQLQEAIRLYFRADASGLLILQPETAAHSPKNAIEALGVEERGTRYRLSPDIRNGAVAVLALAHAADSLYNAENANSFASRIAAMFLTI